MSRDTSAEGAPRWEFRSRLRRNAFGWRSSPLAVRRVREAVSEVKQVRRTDPVRAAEGAVLLLERLSPALEQVDSSSGALGTAVDNAIRELVPVVAGADVPAERRARWLDRLWAAHEADAMPYLELLSDHWGELCGSREVAGEWADRLLDATRSALSPDGERRAFFHGTSACLSALYRAERHEEIVELLETGGIWPYARWAVESLVALGRRSEAIRFAESCRGRGARDGDIDAACEAILLSSGLVDEAYRRYGLQASRGTTYLATFRAIARKYPGKPADELLADLVRSTPGQESKWFAAAKDAGLYEEALALAGSGPCDPRTLTRAARDFHVSRPAFARGAGMLALHWLVEGYGYEITSADVLAAHSATMAAAAELGTAEETRAEITRLVAGERRPGFVAQVLEPQLGA